MKALITGATGFIGSELLRSLFFDDSCEAITAVIRPLAGMSAEERFQRLLAHWSKFVEVPNEAQLHKLQLLDADLLSLQRSRFELASITHIFHAAASTDLGATLSASRQMNVQVTQNLIRIARKLPKLERFVHFSTAYVCGKNRGLVSEETAPPLAFHNHYEKAKRESEESVRASGLPYTILRPSIVVGRSDNGYAHHTKVLYSVWKIWLKGLVPRAPLDVKAWVDLVPVDFVTNATLFAARSPALTNQTMHLVAGGGRQSPKAIVTDAAKSFAVPSPPLSPPIVLKVLLSRCARPFLSHGMREVVEALRHHIPYLGIRNRLFSTKKMDLLIPETKLERPDYNAYGRTLFDFCKATNWGKKPLLLEKRVCSKSA